MKSKGKIINSLGMQKGCDSMKQIISKNGKVYCTTTVPYPKETIKQMKEAGYTVKTVKDENDKKEV